MIICFVYLSSFFSGKLSLIELINWIELITMQLCTYQYYAHYPSQAMYGERYGICLTSIWHQNLYYKWEIWPLYACTEVWTLTSKSPHKPHLLGGEIPDIKKGKHRCNKVYHTVGYKISNIKVFSRTSIWKQYQEGQA